MLCDIPRLYTECGQLATVDALEAAAGTCWWGVVLGTLDAGIRAGGKAYGGFAFGPESFDPNRGLRLAGGSSTSAGEPAHDRCNLGQRQPDRACGRSGIEVRFVSRDI